MNNTSNKTNKSNTNSNNHDTTTSATNTFYAVPEINIAFESRKPAANYLANDYQNDIINFSNSAKRTTGFSKLDKEQQNIYPGLYVLGAVSSLGKTTFIHQISDNLASNGDHVLYFSLEQTEFELVSKSHSRILSLMRSQSNDPRFPQYSALDLRKGCGLGNPIVQQAADTYASTVENRMVIVPSMFSLPVEGIIWTISDYIDKYDIKPVVVIDYMQIIKPSTINGRQLDGRASMDYIIHNLKCFQSKHNLVMFVISSLNRQNYMTPIDFESFKESGGIEYTADVIWGLQLSIMSTNDIFEKEGHIKEKRDAVAAAKKANPRKVDLVCLKNRYGVASYKVPFYYKPTCDLFYDTPIGSQIAP